MNALLHFFRDIVAGPVYIVYLFFLIFLFFACIGYLAEKKLDTKKDKDKYAKLDPNLTTSGVPTSTTMYTRPVVSDATPPENLQPTPLGPVSSKTQVSNEPRVEPIVTVPIMDSKPVVATIPGAVTTPQVVSMPDQKNIVISEPQAPIVAKPNPIPSSSQGGIGSSQMNSQIPTVSPVVTPMPNSSSMPNTPLTGDQLSSVSIPTIQTTSQSTSESMPIS